MGHNRVIYTERASLNNRDEQFILRYDNIAVKDSNYLYHIYPGENIVANRRIPLHPSDTIDRWSCKIYQDFIINHITN